MERDAFGRPLQPQPLVTPEPEPALVLPEPDPVEPSTDPLAAEVGVSSQPTPTGSALIPTDLKSWELGTRVRLQLPDRSPLELQVTEISPRWGFEAQLAGRSGRYRLLQVGPMLLRVDVLHPEEHLRFREFSGARAAEEIWRRGVVEHPAQFGKLTVNPRPRIDLTLELRPVDPDTRPLIGVRGGGWFAQPLGWYLRQAAGEWRAIDEKEGLRATPLVRSAKLGRAGLIAIGLAALYWLFGQHPA